MGVAELPLRDDFPVAFLLLLVAAAVGAFLLFFGVLVLAASERGAGRRKRPGRPALTGRAVPSLVRASLLFAYNAPHSTPRFLCPHGRMRKEGRYEGGGEVRRMFGRRRGGGRGRRTRGGGGGGGTLQLIVGVLVVLIVIVFLLQLLD
jgi:hypothetical protein